MSTSFEIKKDIHHGITVINIFYRFYFLKIGYIDKYGLFKKETFYKKKASSSLPLHK